MKGMLRWVLPALGVALAALAVAALVPTKPMPRPSAEAGFVSRTVAYAPHPYTFLRPASWSDDVHDRSGRPGVFGVILVGPTMADGRFRTMMQIDAGPTAATQAEKPLPNIVNPYQSLEDLERRHLPSKKRTVSATTAVVDGRTARDVVYDFPRVAFSGPGQEAGNTVNCRGRAVFFEDRGYHYILSVQAQDIEYERYLAVFDKLLASFRFLD